MEYYAGIDGGGTKTTVLLGDKDGNIIEKKVLGAFNINSIGEDGFFFGVLGHFFLGGLNAVINLIEAFLTFVLQVGNHFKHMGIYRVGTLRLFENALTNGEAIAVKGVEVRTFSTAQLMKATIVPSIAIEHRSI